MQKYTKVIDWPFVVFKLTMRQHISLAMVKNMTWASNEEAEKVSKLQSRNTKLQRASLFTIFRALAWLKNWNISKSANTLIVYDSM